MQEGKEYKGEGRVKIDLPTSNGCSDTNTTSGVDYPLLDASNVTKMAAT